MKTSEIAKELGISAPQARRMAQAGKIPGTRTTKGGHYRITNCPTLKSWIMANRRASGLLDLTPTWAPSSTVSASEIIDHIRWLDFLFQVGNIDGLTDANAKRIAAELNDVKKAIFARLKPQPRDGSKPSHRPAAKSKTKR